MRRMYFLMLMFVSLNLFAACDKETSTEPNQEQPGGSFQPSGNSKVLVAYFSATGNTRQVAERIAELTGADLYRIQPTNPYAANPYDDSSLIQNEAYNDLRPGVANLPESLDGYDVIYVGSPIWWHQPAMVACTFLESYDLSGKTIVPFFTYGATSYLNESMQKIYKVTPNSTHVPATLPENLDPDNIREPQSDDTGIYMPGNANGVEAWLQRLGLNDKETSLKTQSTDDHRIYVEKNELRIRSGKATAYSVYSLQGISVHRGELNIGETVCTLPSGTYLVRIGERVSKIVMG